MRWKWVLGAAALAGVAAAGTVVVRERRRIADLDPAEIRARLQERQRTAVADGGDDATIGTAAESRTVASLDDLEAAVTRHDWRAADDLTRRLVLSTLDRPAGLAAADVAGLDRDLLAEIDRLWTTGSGGRFGFVAQLGVIGDAWDSGWDHIGSRFGWIDPDHGWMRHAELDADIHPVGRFPWTPGWLGPAASPEPGDTLDRIYAQVRTETALTTQPVGP